MFYFKCYVLLLIIISQALYTLCIKPETKISNVKVWFEIYEWVQRALVA